MPDPCGNGVIDGEEQCDNGINNDAPYHEGGKPAEGVCAKDCADVGYCGDDNLNGREECDDGMDLNVTGPYAPSSTACTDACLHVTEWCGDTTVNGPELCDDGNNADDDGCTSDCSMIEERRVFVTSETYPSDFKTNDNPMGVEGLALADYRCNTLAKALPGAGSYKAWLSTSSESPSSRFGTKFTGNYILFSNENGGKFHIVAENWDDLTNESLDHAINADETGATVTTAKNPWTGTTAKGTSEPADMMVVDQTCSDWTDATDTNNNKASVGASSAVDKTWTAGNKSLPCSDDRRIYCFQTSAP